MGEAALAVENLPAGGELTRPPATAPDACSRASGGDTCRSRSHANRSALAPEVNLFTTRSLKGAWIRD